MSDGDTRILLVDDEESITDFVGYALRKEGFSVDVAADGTVALGLDAKGAYDLYVLDIMLPGIDGYDLCRRIRQHSCGGDGPLTSPSVGTYPDHHVPPPLLRSNSSPTTAPKG